MTPLPGVLIYRHLEEKRNLVYKICLLMYTEQVTLTNHIIIENFHFMHNDRDIRRKTLCLGVWNKNLHYGNAWVHPMHRIPRPSSSYGRQWTWLREWHRGDPQQRPQWQRPECRAVQKMKRVCWLWCECSHPARTQHQASWWSWFWWSVFW